MNFSIWKDGVLSVHKFVEKDSYGIGVIADMMGRWIFFEVDVIEIRDIRSISEYLGEFLIDWNRFSNSGNAIFYVNILDVEHVDRFQRRFLYDFNRVEQREEEELNMFLLQRNAVSLQPFYIIL